METAWIQVFVLSLTQCIAPAGKMVCQEETVEYHFAAEDDCARALAQIVDLAARADNILVSRERSNCSAATRESIVFAEAEGAKASLANSEDVVIINRKTPTPDFTQAGHTERLQRLKSCEETQGIAPCKIGDIIIEGAAETGKTEVWRQQN